MIEMLKQASIGILKTLDGTISWFQSRRKIIRAKKLIFRAQNTTKTGS